jgi:hypothetical protein
MSCSSCGPSTPLAEILKATSPKELAKAELEPKEPFDPKTLSADFSATQDPFDLASSANTVELMRAAKAPGTGLRVDVTA